MPHDKDQVLSTGKKARRLIIGVSCIIIIQIVVSVIVSSLMVRGIEKTRIDELRKSWDNFLDLKYKEVFNYVLGYALWTDLNNKIVATNGNLSEADGQSWLSQNETINDLCLILRRGRVVLSGGKEIEKLQFLIEDPLMKKIYQETSTILKSETKRYILNYPERTLLLVASPLYDDSGEAIITDGIDVFVRVLENNIDVASSFLNSKLKIGNSLVENKNGFVIAVKDTFDPKKVRYVSVTPNINIARLVFLPIAASTSMQVVIVVFILLTFFFLLKGITGLTINFQNARDALWGEMELAKKIQTCLLPAIPSGAKYDIAATMLPAAEVGGDYYDFIEGDDGRRWIAIGDVTGHGVSSGLIMMMAQSAVTGLIKANPAISAIEVVTYLNTVLYQNIRDRMKLRDYLTFSILVEESSGSFIFAGMHEPILVYRDKTGTVEEIDTTGPWVGLIPEVKEHLCEGRFTVAPGDILVLYTDGVIEAASADAKQFDIPNLRQSIERNAKLPAAEIVNAIVADVRGWMHEQKDDITILALKYLG